MSANVLLNSINKLRKSHKMRGLPSILSLFRNVFNKFINTRAGILDSIYHMLENQIFDVKKTSKFCHILDVIMYVIMLRY